jgi:CheY-like chemotaxis protein
VSLASERVRGLLERCASNEAGMSDVAVRELAAELRHLDAVLEHAQQGSTRVRQIVRELSCFARADEDEPGALDVRQVLESTIAMSFNEIRHCARLVRRFEEVPLVSAAESRLGQVFLNILLNAAQAIGEGNADDNEIRVTVAQDPNGRVVIEFTDTGPGIAPEVVPHVFDPFFTTKPVGAGTGLGLSICHDIVVSLGGELQVQSEVGSGATFRVILPPVAPSIPPSVNIRVPAVISRARRGRILVVDDEPKVARMLRMSLEEEHDVAVVHSGREALTLLSTDGSFDLVLCDLMMPDIGGMEVYEHLARSKPELAARIVFVSGGAFTPRTRTFLESVPNPTLDKPFDLETIRTVVRDRMGCALAGHLSGGGS